MRPDAGRRWPPEDGNFGADLDRIIQTMTVPPGSRVIGETETPVPERFERLGHALSRGARKGPLAEIDVQGSETDRIDDPDAKGTSHE